ncbi:uncharacterized protein LOC131696368 [Topomyia yanbarensis]|uniref:uncharacterized protein LOC131696368 n=1 Tax=Topomyia yanbarensis TaxID=2498891 RepID=UPI00273C384D|nr:uncharacterized protein LOC131696368 [Topomyia yanbarensis]
MKSYHQIFELFHSSRGQQVTICYGISNVTTRIFSDTCGNSSIYNSLRNHNVICRFQEFRRAILEVPRESARRKIRKCIGDTLNLAELGIPNIRRMEHSYPIS